MVENSFIFEALDPDTGNFDTHVLEASFIAIKAIEVGRREIAPHPTAFSGSLQCR